MAHAHKDAEPLSNIQPSVPADLEQVVMRCLAKDPKHRFRDAASLELALLACECAGKWTDDAADAWWSKNKADNHSGKQQEPVDPTTPQAGPEETIDLN
jgi:serine/threonine-protein kinase